MQFFQSFDSLAKVSYQTVNKQSKPIKRSIFPELKELEKLSNKRRISTEAPENILKKDEGKRLKNPKIELKPELRGKS